MKKIIIASALALSSSVAFADGSNASDRYVYAGAEIGKSEPVVKSFNYTDDFSRTTKIRLKQSAMYGGRVGYSFYPNMAVELSYTHQPRYKLGYVLPKTPVVLPAPYPVTSIPETSDETKVGSNVYMLNLLYFMQKQYMGIRPYAIVGAGLAKVSIKPNITTTGALAALGKGNNFGFFRINKNNINCFAWQAGGGLIKDIGENFMIDLSAKLQVVNDIKIEYDAFSVAANGYVAQKPIKKTIGVGEFTIGFTFKLPV